MRSTIVPLLSAAVLMVAFIPPVRSEPQPPTATATAAAPDAPLPLGSPLRLLRPVSKDFKSLTEAIPGGQIDWTDGVVYAVGAAKLRSKTSGDFQMAQRGARLLAVRNALLLSQGIRVGAGGRFADLKDGRVSLDAVVKDFQETDSDYDPKADAVISRIRLPLHGQKGIIQVVGLTVEKPAKQWPGPDLSNTHVAVPSLILVDLRGSAFKPCLLPAVVNEAGESVLSQEARMRVSYVCLEPKVELAPLLADKSRIREHVVALAGKVAEGNHVLLDKAAMAALAANAVTPGKVVFVLDAPVGAAPAPADPRPIDPKELDRIP